MSPYRPHNVARAFGTHWGLDFPGGCGLRPYPSGKSLLYGGAGTGEHHIFARRGSSSSIGTRGVLVGRRNARAWGSSTLAAAQHAAALTTTASECDDGGYTAKVEAAVLTAEELREERHAQPLLRELDVPAWQEVAVMRPRWRAMLKSIKIRTVR